MLVKIKIPAKRVEQIDTETRNQTTVEIHDEVTVVFKENVRGNPNFDAYLQPIPDLLYNYISNGKFSVGGIEHHLIGNAEVVFDCYADGLRKAAQKRAGEDCTDEVSVLNEWFDRAKANDHHTVLTELERAIKRAEDDQ